MSNESIVIIRCVTECRILVDRLAEVLKIITTRALQLFCKRILPSGSPMFAHVRSTIKTRKSSGILRESIVILTLLRCLGFSPEACRTSCGI